MPGIEVSTATVRLHPLTYLPEHDDVVVGRTDTDSYAVFPQDGAELIRQLAAGRTLEDAARWYEQTYGDRVDLADFLQTLTELDFLADAGPATGAEPAAPAGSTPPARMPWQRLGAAVFSPVGWLVVGAVAAAAVVVCALRPELRPSRDHVFFSRYLLVVEIGVAAGQLVLVLLHEVCHVLAGRRLGLRCHIRLGRRLYFLVFETVLDGLVIVPRHRRWLPMLAGMIFDVVAMCALTLVAAAVYGPGPAPSLAAGLCLALAFTTLPRVAMEFLFFLRTDVYYLVSTLCGCVDLHTTSREMVTNALWSLLRRPDRRADPVRWHPKDVRAARWYAPLFVVGYAVAFALLAGVLVPIVWRFASTAVVAAMTLDVRSAAFWDATGLLVLNGAQPALAGVLALRERARRATNPRSVPPTS
jgi:hypothetical protein